MKKITYIIVLILVLLQSNFIPTVFGQEESVVLTPAEITTLDPANSGQKGVNSASSGGSPFYYYVNGSRVSLEPSKNWISIQYKEESAKALSDIQRDYGSFIGPADQIFEIPYPKITLLPIKDIPTTEDLVEVVETMRELSSAFIQVNPVFETDDVRMIITDEFIVHFLPQFSQADIEELNAKNNVEIVGMISGQENAYNLRVLPIARVDALTMANRYQERGYSVNSSPNFLRIVPTQPKNTSVTKEVGPLSGTNDAYYSDQWYLNNTQQYGSGMVYDADIDAPEAWNISTGISSIIIAVVDEGVDLIHEDLRDKIVTGYDATGLGSGGGYQNDDAHGTNVAGIAAAITNNSLGVAGVCQNCKIMPVRIAYDEYYDGGSYWVTYDSWIADGITWAYQHGADVINNSWGGGSESFVITYAIEKAKTLGRGGKGSIVVASAGNGDSEYVIYPARLSSVISVGASNMCDQRKSPTNDFCNGYEYWWGSSYGTELDISAPGVWLDSTDITGAAGYTDVNYNLYFNGTSGAAPIVSGVAGLILSINPGLTADQVRNILLHTTDDIDIDGWDKYTGFGRVNAYNAVVKAQASLTNSSVIFHNKAKFDFDGDGDTDLAVFRVSDGTWQIQGQSDVRFGQNGDIPVSGDYDGNGTTDIAVFRPSNGYWYIRNQNNIPFGQAGDIPIPGDYDGNGTTDIAVFRPSNGYWYIRNQNNIPFGQAGDIPIPGDYNADGKTDVAVYRMSNGGWYIKDQFNLTWMGGPGAIPVPGDYDGDGKTELVIYWLSGNNYSFTDQYDYSFEEGCIPVPGDYDGDGKTESAVFSSKSDWWTYPKTYITESVYGYSNDYVYFGEVGDYPIPQIWRGVTTTAPVESDYNADNRTDIPVFQPSNSYWYDSWIFDFPYFGEAGDIRVPGDYDGDGFTDPAIFRPSNGNWYIRNRRDNWYDSNYEIVIPFGQSGDIPVPADYNADGKADIALFRPSNGYWYVRNQYNVPFGQLGDVPVPADYNADGAADIALFRPSNGYWYVKNQYSIPFGQSGDIPVPADYNGDGTADVALFRPSNNGSWSWFVRDQFTMNGKTEEIPFVGDYDGDGKYEVALTVSGR
ncbi:MAG: S8 family serine peptidase [Flexilinea sp.]